MGAKGKEIVGVDVRELIADLNRAYADEWLAAYAYNYMAQVVTGRPAARQLASVLKETSKEELEHQEELAGRITSLGGVPLADITQLVAGSNAGYPTPPKDPRDFDGMVKVVVKAERDAIEVYQKLTAKTHGKDPITYELVVHLLGEEVEHEDGFENLLG